jgi:hypothetical protein
VAGVSEDLSTCPQEYRHGSDFGHTDFARAAVALLLAPAQRPAVAKGCVRASQARPYVGGAIEIVPGPGSTAMQVRRSPQPFNAGPAANAD